MNFLHQVLYFYLKIETSQLDVMCLSVDKIYEIYHQIKLYLYLNYSDYDSEEKNEKFSDLKLNRYRSTDFRGKFRVKKMFGISICVGIHYFGTFPLIPSRTPFRYKEWEHLFLFVYNNSLLEFAGIISRRNSVNKFFSHRKKWARV